MVVLENGQLELCGIVVLLADLPGFVLKVLNQGMVVLEKGQLELGGIVVLMLESLRVEL